MKEKVSVIGGKGLWQLGCLFPGWTGLQRKAEQGSEKGGWPS